MTIADRLAKASIGIALLLAVIMTMGVWGQWLTIVFIWAIGFPLSVFIIGFSVGLIATHLGAQLQEEPQAVFTNDDVVVVNHGDLVGTLDGKPFYEFVVITRPDTKENIHLVYESLVDWDNGYTPEPDRWFVMLNGALYLEPKVPEIEALD